ncbi:MAG: TRAP transporter small permease [Hyphomicrobiales bacterium]|nr:TRAP transporter small permease [Hyphomicrobiales bacterium]
MGLLAKLYDGLIAVLAILAGASVVVITIAVVVDVLMRAAGWSPPAVTSALVEYLLLYFALFAAPYLVRKKAHVVIDALVTRLPDGARIVVEKFAYLISIVMALVFAYISLQLLLDSLDSGRFDERSVDIPMWLLYAPMPIGFFCVASEFARYLFGVDRFYQERTEVKDSV